MVSHARKAERNQERKTMDEEIQRERELSEEQLGEISGGCRACGADRHTINQYTSQVEMYQALARIAQHLELPELAAGYSRQAEVKANQIQQVQLRLDTRHPRGEEPANKRQRLG